MSEKFTRRSMLLGAALAGSSIATGPRAAPRMSDEEVYARLNSAHGAGTVDKWLTDLAAEQEAEGNSKLATEFRKQCERLIGFTEYRYARYVTAPRHALVASHLERVERREIDRLIIEMPPRHGKSELASKSYPAWCIGRNPTKQIISASASNDLATDWRKAVRNIIASDEFKLVYPGVELAEDSRAAGKWQTKQGGIYVAASVGTSILGRGADEYLIDDPFGTMADARSEVMRENVWDWFNGTVYNRLQPGGAIIVINHRMHEDDLVGRLIERTDVDGRSPFTMPSAATALPLLLLGQDQLLPSPNPHGLLPFRTRFPLRRWPRLPTPGGVPTPPGVIGGGAHTPLEGRWKGLEGRWKERWKAAPNYAFIVVC